MGNAFEDALANAARAAKEQAAPDEPAPLSIRFAPEVSPATGAGSHSLWELAAAWTPEADPPSPPPPPPAPPRPSEHPRDVARELGLAWLKDPLEVARARRRFMWDNHPDRRADLDAELANRRVALANMLLDDVLERLLGRRGR